MVTQSGVAVNTLMRSAARPRHDREAFVSRDRSLSEEDHMQDVVHQIHVLAKRLAERHKWINWSVYLLICALVQMALVALALAFVGPQLPSASQARSVGVRSCLHGLLLRS